MIAAFNATPQRRYTWRVMSAMTAYVALILIVVSMFKNDPPTGWPAYALAVLPAIPILLVFRAIGLLIIETDDEYQRMLLVKQTLLGTGLTLAIATVWGFLENFDLVSRPDGYHVAVLWFAMWGVAAAIVRWRA